MVLPSEIDGGELLASRSRYFIPGGKTPVSNGQTR
jgi:hypothetical protein